MELKFHPLANIFPLIEGAEFDALVADVKENGLLEPITLLDGFIIDGRNRFRACKEAKIDPWFVAYGNPDNYEIEHIDTLSDNTVRPRARIIYNEETDETWADYEGELANPLGYVVSLNLHRRHLNEGQRATVGAKLANMRQGERTDLEPSENFPKVSQMQASEMLNVSDKSIRSAKQVIDAVEENKAIPEIVTAMEQGRLAPSMAEKIVKADPEIQKKIIDRVNEGAKPTEAARQVIAAAKSERRVAEPTGKYRVIYADPPWSYGNSMPDEFGEQRDHYPVMSLDEICAMPVKEWAEDDAVLFLWVTSPILEESFEVIRSWGFNYKASFIWDKVKHVMGHYNSVRHEILLVCVRGSCQPDVRKLYDSVVSIERTEHSRKPEYFYEIIETLYTHGTKLELFRRGEARIGWKAYGNEVADAA